MSEILMPEKVLIRNTSTKYPIAFLDNNGTAVAATAATRFSVNGYGTFPVAQLSNAKLVRPLAPRFEKWSLTAATAGEITVAGSIPANTEVVVEMFVESTRRQFSLARPEYEFGQLFRFVINLNAGETAGTFLAKLYNSVMVEFESKQRELIVASGSGTAGTFANGRATTLTELELEIPLRGAFVKYFRVSNKNGSPSSFITVFNPTRIVTMSPGIGYGSDVEFGNKLASYNNTPYHYDFDDIPTETGLYTEVSFSMTAATRDPQSSILSRNVRFVMFLNAATCETDIDNLADLFSQVGFTNTEFYGPVAGVYTNNITAAQFKTNV